MKKALVIFNPSAGLNSKQDVLGLVKSKLNHLGYHLDIFLLNKGFESRLASHDLASTKLVVAVGGDGTVKVAARTILQNKLNVPLAIVPFGSANIVAATLGIPIKIEAALKLFNKSHRVKIDVGLINKNIYFLTGFSVGYISKVIISTSHQLKNRFGFFGYVIKFFFNKIRLRKIKFKIQTRGRTYSVKGNSLIIFNAWNFLGFKPKKPISLNDGILNLYITTNKTFISTFEALFYLFLYQKPPRYIFSLDRDYFRITFNHQLRSCQIDGDYIRLPREIELEVLPKVLSVLAPKK